MVRFQTKTLIEALKWIGKVKAWSWTSDPLAHNVLVEAQGETLTVKTATGRAALALECPCVDERDRRRAMRVVLKFKDVETIVSAAANATGLVELGMDEHDGTVAFQGDGGFKASACVVNGLAEDWFDIEGEDGDMYDVTALIPSIETAFAAVHMDKDARLGGGWRSAIGIAFTEDGVPYAMAGTNQVFAEASIGKHDIAGPPWTDTILVPAEVVGILDADKQLRISKTAVSVAWHGDGYSATLLSRLVQGAWPVQCGFAGEKARSAAWTAVVDSNLMASAASAAEAFLADSRQSWVVELAPQTDSIRLTAVGDDGKTLVLPLPAEFGSGKRSKVVSRVNVKHLSRIAAAVSKADETTLRCSAVTACVAASLPENVGFIGLMPCAVARGAEKDDEDPQDETESPAEEDSPPTEVDDE